MTMRLDIVTNDAGDLVRREHARDLGAGVVQAIYRLAKLALVHDLGNQAFVRQLEQSTAAVHDYCQRAGYDVSILFAQRAVFVAGQLLKGSRAVYDQAIELGQILEWCGGSELVVQRDVTQDEMLAFAEAVSQATRSERGRFRSPSPKIRLRAVADKARLRGLEIEDLDTEQRVVRTYASAVVIMRRFFDDLHAGRYILPRRIKRIAQNLVDLSERGTAAFLGVTEARNANHDAAGRAVNCAVLSVSMAREITADRVTLAQIAMASLMHDVARPRASAIASGQDALQMPGVMALSEEQEDRLAGGTAAVLTALGRLNEPSITRTVVTFEALWQRRQQWIGAVYRGVRAPTLHARIVALARRYNDLMTPEPGCTPPTSDFVVATISQELKEPADKTVLRMLVAALGLVPVGTVVQLSTGEVGEIVARPDAAPPDRPRVRVAIDAQGGVVSEPVEIDLAREPPIYIARVMSVDGWRKGLSANAPDAFPEPPPSRSSVSRAAHEPPPSSSGVDHAALRADVPSRSVSVSSRGSSRVEPVGDASPEHRAPSAPMLAAAQSAAPAVAAVPPSAAPASATPVHPSAPAQAAGAPSSAAPRPVAAASQPPADGRTLFQPSRFEDVEDDAHPAEQEEPTAVGSLAATPFVHVLVYMLDHALSGSVVFAGADGESTVHFHNGVPAKARLASGACLLGEELVRTGKVPANRLDELVVAALGAGRLFGRHCVASHLVSREDLDAALERQLIDRIALLSNLSPATGYAYYRDMDLLESWTGGEMVRVGPLNAVLSAVRAWSDRARIAGTLKRIGEHPLVFDDDADLESLCPNEAEQAVLDAIVTKPCSLPQLLEMRVADEGSVTSIVYTLAITRQFAFGGQKKGPMAARPRTAVPIPSRSAPVSLRSARPSLVVRPMGASSDRPSVSERPPSVSERPPVERSAPSVAPPPSVGASALNVWAEAAAAAHVPSAAPTSSEGRNAPVVLARPPGPSAPLSANDAAESSEGDGPFAEAAERALEAMTNFRLAEAALQRGDTQRAEEHAKLAAEAEPDQAEYLALHAWVKAMASSPDRVGEAIATISAILEKEPTCERALLYRGKLYKRVNDPASALQDFESVLRKNPRHRDAATEVRLLKMHLKS